ncbi:MAG: permease prefix domain 1-containing protein [Bryobacteraceae bacterium]
MRFARQIQWLLLRLLRKRQGEESLDAEIGSHLEEGAARWIAAGLSDSEARRRARIEVGSMALLKDEVRDVWVGRGLETAAQDAAFACRSLLRTPGFTALVIGTLSVGIGPPLPCTAWCGPCCGGRFRIPSRTGS